MAEERRSGRKRVVIVGGGFAGLEAAKKLGNQEGVDVVLIDRSNHHLFQPLLYQVAMAGLNPSDIAAPIRAVLAKYKNIRVYMTEALDVDQTNKVLKTSYKDFSFDYLMLACGVNHSYFGNEKWEPFAPGLKTLSQALEIRDRMLTAFEKAEIESDPVKQKQLLTFIVVGAGPTGVELAGSLGEMTRYTLARDFKSIDPRNTRVILLEGGNRVLPGFSERQSQIAKRDLEELGVQVWVSSPASDITAEGVHIGSEIIRAETVIWAAGVKPPEMNIKLGIPLSREGLVPVKQDLSIETSSDIFVVGDQALFIDEKGERITGLSPIAIQQGRLVARNILREISGQARKNFKYFDKGKMATIGRSKAIAKVGTLEFSGFIAWLAWIFVHIYYLIGFRSRVLVMIQWGISYLTFQKGARLIVDRRNWRSYKKE